MKWSSLSAFQGKVVKLSKAEIKGCNFRDFDSSYLGQ